MTEAYVPGAVSNLLGSDQATSKKAKKSKDDHLSALFSPEQPSQKKKKTKGLKDLRNYEKAPKVSNLASNEGTNASKKKASDLGNNEVTNTPKKKRKKSELIDELEEQYETKKAKKQDATEPSAPKVSESTAQKAPESSKKNKKEFPRPRRDRKKKENQENQENRTIFVGNLSVDVDKKTVKKLFKKYGEVESLRFRSAAPADLTLPKKAIMIMKNFHDQRRTLNCYVVFKEESATKDALKENGTELKGLHMRVDLASTSVQHKHSNSVFVGNLPFDAEEEPLRQHFEDCGDVENVRLIRDRKTQLGKGFGYVSFSDKASVELALKLNGESCLGRKLRISRSSKNPSGFTPKDKNPTKRIRPKNKSKQKKDIKKPSLGDKETFQGIKATKNEKKMKSKLKMSDTKFKKPKLGPKKDSKKHARKIPSSKIGARNRIAKKMNKGKKSSSGH